MIVKKLMVGPIETNCYILIDEATRECAVVDPGAEPERILEVLGEDRNRLRYILLTHGHIDHIGAVAELKRRAGAQVLIHPDEAPLLEDELLNGSRWLDLPFSPCRADRSIREGEEIRLGDSILRPLDTPGHSPGGLSLLFENNVITGDCLFREGRGRTDLPGGDNQAIQASLKKLLALEEQRVVCPGHGPNSTIAHERCHNPYVK